MGSGKKNRMMSTGGGRDEWWRGNGNILIKTKVGQQGIQNRERETYHFLQY